MGSPAAQLVKLNLITHLDRGALATYCGAYALWAEAMVQIQKYGTMVKSPTGYPMQSPYLSVANMQAELMMRIASDFGFTIASSSRISAPPPDQLPLPDLRANDEEEEPNQEDPGGWGARSISGGRWSRGPAPYHSGNFFSPSMIFGLTPASVRVAKLVAEQSDCIIQCLRFSESQVEQVRRACCSFLDHLFSHCIQPRVGGV